MLDQHAKHAFYHTDYSELHSIIVSSHYRNNLLKQAKYMYSFPKLQRDFFTNTTGNGEFYNIYI